MNTTRAPLGRGTSPALETSGEDTARAGLREQDLGANSPKPRLGRARVRTPAQAADTVRAVNLGSSLATSPGLAPLAGGLF